MITQLLRIKHWVKNFFIFLPAFFGGVFFDMEVVSSVFLAFVAFCAVSSSIYIVNDLRDIDFDRKHPKKKLRPIPAGRISLGKAKGISAGLVLIGFAIALFVSKGFLVILAIYFINNLLYSFGAKNYAIVDIVMVALGFLLRVVAGGVVAGVVLSKWLLAITMLLALFLVIAKRRDDVLLKESNGAMRKVTEFYNLEFINGMMYMIATLVVMCYIMYTFHYADTFGDDNYLVFSSSFFVLLGILRYFQIVFVEQNSGSPTDLLYRDRFLQVTILFWLSLFAASIYIQ